MADEIKRMSVAEFQRLGFLQEVNRRVLHPLGMALEVIHHDNGLVTFGGVWDYRDDPEGMRFYDDGPDTWDRAKAAYFDQEWRRKAAVRQQRLGYVVQGENEHG